MSRAERRNFSPAARLAIIKRATDSSGRLHCRACGVWIKSRRDFEIDHLICEGVRPPADKGRRLTAADGQLLCLQCHQRKTARDLGDIARAKRREAAHFGATARTTDKPEKPPLSVAEGAPGMARRFQQRSERTST
jgi:hypothetical protein